MDALQKHLVDGHETDKQQLRQLENVDEVNAFQNYKSYKTTKVIYLLVHVVQLYNPNRKDESFVNKIREIRRDLDH